MFVSISSGLWLNRIRNGLALRVRLKTIPSKRSAISVTRSNQANLLITRRFQFPTFARKMIQVCYANIIKWQRIPVPLPTSTFLTSKVLTPKSQTLGKSKLINKRRIYILNLFRYITIFCDFYTSCVGLTSWWIFLSISFWQHTLYASWNMHRVWTAMIRASCNKISIITRRKSFIKPTSNSDELFFLNTNTLANTTPILVNISRRRFQQATLISACYLNVWYHISCMELATTY